MLWARENQLITHHFPGYCLDSLSLKLRHLFKSRRAKVALHAKGRPLLGSSAKPSFVTPLGASAFLLAGSDRDRCPIVSAGTHRYCASTRGRRPAKRELAPGPEQGIHCLLVRRSAISSRRSPLTAKMRRSLPLLHFDRGARRLPSPRGRIPRNRPRQNARRSPSAGSERR